MTQGFWFSDQDKLLAALLTELIPTKRQQQTIAYWRNGKGIGVLPKRVSKGLRADLLQQGIEEIAAPEQQQTAQCWPALLMPTATTQPQDYQQILFILPTTELLTWVSELLRLGCQQCHYQIPDKKQAITLLKVVNPPYYIILRCNDKYHRAFYPIFSGQQHSWIEWGYQHPLPQQLQPPTDYLALMSRDGDWVWWRQAQWYDVMTNVQLQLPSPKLTHQAAEAQRFTIPLQLVSSQQPTVTSLWLLQQDAQQQVEQLVLQLPADTLNQLSFAVTQQTPPQILLKARFLNSIPELNIGIACTALATLPQLYIPSHQRFEPPLNHAVLIKQLAPEPEHMSWLLNTDHGLQQYHLAETAFHPLTDWVDYILGQASESLTAWYSNSHFDFSEFIINDDIPTAPTTTQIDEALPKQKPHQRQHKKAKTPLIITETSSKTEISVTIDQQAHSPEDFKQPAYDEQAAQQLAELEQTFLQTDVTRDRPEYSALWANMAQLNVQLQQLQNAALCWLQALWYSTPSNFNTYIQQWANAECQYCKHSSETLLWLPLSQTNIDPSLLRAIIVQWIYYANSNQTLPSPPEQTISQGLQNIILYFDQHQQPLDVRSIWLLRLALSKLSGGDSLMLASARDQLLMRLHHGLNPAQDIPAFLRFSEHQHYDANTMVQLNQALTTLLDYFQQTKRKPSALEAPNPLTSAYVQLSIAYAFARLSQAETAQTLCRQAIASLPDTDSIHQYLTQAYQARIEQALSGQSTITPLPTALTEQLNQLPKLSRYKVDRLRQASQILETQQHLDPVQDFHQKNELHQQFTALRQQPQAEIFSQLQQLINDIQQIELETRGQTIDHILDCLPLLPEHQALPLLQQILPLFASVPLQQRLLLVEEALLLAGFWHAESLINPIFNYLQQLTQQIITENQRSMMTTLVDCLHNLRRVGLQQKVHAILTQLDQHLAKTTDIEGIIARLHIASAWANFDQADMARTILIQCQKATTKLSLLPAQRLQLLQAFASVWRYLPTSEAIEGLASLAKQLPEITDSYNTNSHFCLSVLIFMETLALSYIQHDLNSNNPTIQKWLDDDEYQIRTRIHQDVSQLQ